MDGKAAKEIGFSLFITFSPLLLAALIASANSEDGYFSALFGYFLGGELGLFILTICGSVAWTIFVNKEVNFGQENLIPVIFTILAVIAAASIIGSNPSFEGNIAGSLQACLFILYFAMLIIWYRSIGLDKKAKHKIAVAKRGLRQKNQVSDETEILKSLIGDAND